ncbi:MAG: hypothetical protein AAF500_17695 [Myxococcota bacterium]
MDERVWSLLAVGIMMGAVVGGSFLDVWWARFIDERRDAVVSGRDDSGLLTLRQRWQYFSDWISNVAAFVGVNTFLGFAYLQIARLSESSTVDWLGYFGMAITLWTAAMFALQGLVEGTAAAGELRREKNKRTAD